MCELLAMKIRHDHTGAIIAATNLTTGVHPSCPSRKPTAQNVTLATYVVICIPLKVAALPDYNLAQARPHDDDHLPSYSYQDYVWVSISSVHIFNIAQH